MSPTNDPKTGFFSLPRELRDEIYASLFAPSPYLDTTFYGLTLSLHYGPRCCVIPVMRSTHTWLLASKTIMAEALQEYARRAEWVWHGPYTIRKECSLPIPMNMDSIGRIALYVGNLAHWETPYRDEGEDGRDMVRTITDAMRSNGVRADTIRLQGHSYSMIGPGGQTPFMLANLRQAFEGVKVLRWEFEILSGSQKRTELLVEVGPGGDWCVIEDGRGRNMERVHTKSCEEWTKERDDEARRYQAEREERMRHNFRARERLRKLREEAVETTESSNHEETSTAP